MKAILISLLKDIVIEGVPKLVNALYKWASKFKREKERDELLEKYKKSGTAKDLSDLEDSLNNK